MPVPQALESPPKSGRVSAVDAAIAAVKAQVMNESVQKGGATGPGQSVLGGVAAADLQNVNNGVPSGGAKKTDEEITEAKVLQYLRAHPNNANVKNPCKENHETFDYLQ